MPAPIPKPGPDGQLRPGADGLQPPADSPNPGVATGPAQPAADGPGASGEQTQEVWGGPGRVWVEGSADIGPVPVCDRPGPQPEPQTADGLPAGLDYAALVEALAASGALGSDAGDQDIEFAEWQAAGAEGRLAPADPAQMAAVAVEHMPPGAAAAGWLEVAAAGLDRLDENALAGVMIAAHQAAARAQATELAAVAKITSLAAAADRRIGTAADGRPARVCLDALGQIALALRLTPYQADEWAGLAVTLAWRLPATGRALAAGMIDLSRVRLIASATSVLSEQQARQVEQKILPTASELTRAQLLERLTRAVITADPAAAERRREQAERQAAVSLYTDPDGTATLMGAKLPAVHAAAAMARITAIARAMKAAEKTGGLDLHRARVMLGLLLGTLPYIPPPADGPLDQPPHDEDPVGGPGPSDPDAARSDGPGDDPGHPDSDSAHHNGPGNGESATGDGGPGDGSGDDGNPDFGEVHPDDGEGGWDDLPAPRDDDAPPDDGLGDLPGRDAGTHCEPADEDDHLYPAGPAPTWPPLGAIRPGLARPPADPADGRPVPGLLDAVVPWATLAGLADRTGTLGRIGPITAAQARLLAQAAEHDPAAQWRVIVTNTAGQAIAVTRIRRPRRRAWPGGYASGTGRDGPAACRDGPQGIGLVGRLSVTITEDTITAAGYAAGPGPPAGSRSAAGPPGGIAGAALRTAARALHQARAQALADAAAGGCAHTGQSPGYRPAPRLRDYVIARDVTCRSPVCRQPAWRADLDHTQPHDQHGRTCKCNLGGGCRRDHQLKQHPRWNLEQNRPGYFTWTTPAGRTYAVGPDTYPV